jgi:hypothetical protein
MVCLPKLTEVHMFAYRSRRRAVIGLVGGAPAHLNR